MQNIEEQVPTPQERIAMLEGQVATLEGQVATLEGQKVILEQLAERAAMYAIRNLEKSIWYAFYIAKRFCDSCRQLVVHCLSMPQGGRVFQGQSKYSSETQKDGCVD